MMGSTVPVEVRTRYTGQWATGFEVVERTAHGYRLRRLSDGAVLPVEFSSDEVQVREP
jgi:hypothetical protein